MLPPIVSKDPNDQRFRILGIDPGSDCLGIAVVEIDVLCFTVDVIYTHTLKPAKSLKHLEGWVDQYGELETKLRYHQHYLQKLMDYFKPNAVISESPFLGRFPRAFEVLVLCLSMIRQTVRDYDALIELDVVDPPRAKKAVGASGKGGDKDEVRYAIMQHPKIRNATGGPYDLCDQHAIDAIAVACYRVNLLSPDYLEG